MFNKKDVKNFTNVASNGFDFMGRPWRLAYKKNGKPDAGTSPNGLWNTYTDGTTFNRLYKKTLLDANESKLAVTLFN